MANPTCTYRIQLNRDFPFSSLEKILDYLYQLGVSTIYASPITQAIAGSSHGYDGTDPLRINPELGTLGDLERIINRMKSLGMDWIQDIVPNHMAIDRSNRWLSDLLERGNDSPYREHFDIDWDHPDPALRGRLMIPVLGNTLETCLEKKEISLEFSGSGLEIAYFDRRFPATWASYGWLFRGGNPPPPGMLSLPGPVQAIGLDAWEKIKMTWFRQLESNPRVMNWLKGEAERISQDPEKLRELLDAQRFSLCCWKETCSKINYRRFFIINSLICLNMERETVREDYHRFYLDLYEKGLISGLRVDHLDGLQDPEGYLNWLRLRFGPDCFIVVEKILTGDELLSAQWPIQGTTGYEFLGTLNQLFTDRKGAREILEFYGRLTGTNESYTDLTYVRKYNFLHHHMGGELDNLVRLASLLDPVHGGLETSSIKGSLAAWMSWMPVYRAYPGDGPLSGPDQDVLDQAFQAAGHRNPELLPGLQWWQQMLHAPGPGMAAGDWVRLRRRLMQFTVPLAAKGIEDGVFYIYNPLIAHNEVGDTPGDPGKPREWFQERMIRRMEETPGGLNATSTHDTKRGEDARILIHYLSLIPGDWIRQVEDWMNLNQGLVIQHEGKRVPSRNDEYLIYQALVGGTPIGGPTDDAFRERVQGYLKKALREAGTVTSWDQPVAWYESGCASFLDSILDPRGSFWKKFQPWVLIIQEQAWPLSLSQLLIKLTAPGIPDLYMGSESWNQSFVDPDNRRMPDYATLESLARAGGLPEEITPWVRSGKIRIYLIRAVLQFRKKNPELFSKGSYIPLDPGPGWLGFIRQWKEIRVLVLAPFSVPVLPPFQEGFPDPSGTWVNLLGGRVLDPRNPRDWESHLKQIPVAFFVQQSPPAGGRDSSG